MATITDSIGFNKGTVPATALPAGDALWKSVRMELVIDFPKIIAARAAAGVAALTATDVIESIPIPPMTLVRSVGLEVVTVAASGTIALGDGTAAAGFLAAQTLAALGIFGGIPVLAAGAFAPTLSGGKLYSVADTLDITLATAVPALAVVRLFAEFVDL